MLRILKARWLQRHRTIAFPQGDLPVLPDRYRGRPVVDVTKCGAGCPDCSSICPTGALQMQGDAPYLDLGRCIFCGACAAACPNGAVHFTRDFQLATRTRGDLQVRDATYRCAEALDCRARQLFGHSLKLRQVSAGGCNACEADCNVLTTVVFDLGQFGIQFVASPRHADGVLVTGPVTENMRVALLKTYAAIPDPRLVIAVGSCAISGGTFRDHPEQHNGVDGLLPVDLYVPGCPPHPLTILDGLLRLLGRR